MLNKRSLFIPVILLASLGLKAADRPDVLFIPADVLDPDWTPPGGWREDSGI